MSPRLVWSCWRALIALALIGPADAHAARLARAELGADSTPEYEIVEPTTHFAVDVPRVVCVFRVEELSGTSVIRSVWIADDSGEAAPPYYKIDEKSISMPGSGSVNTYKGRFSLSRPNMGWPRGKYHLEIHIDGELVKSLPFTVE